MNDLNQEIQIAFQATQLILVFVTVVFGLRYSRIQSDIHEIIPEGTEAKKRLKKKLKKSFWYNCFPILLISGIASYLFLPLFYRVFADFLKNLGFTLLWNFDFTRASFAFIALLIFYIFGWSIWLMCQFCHRMKEIDKE